MNRFSIRDLENLTGIKAHTIRIWEQRYGILQPKRTPTNIRYYDADDLKLALRVALLNNHGYKISRIQRMSSVEMDALIQKIADRDFRLQVLINEMLEATLAMNTDLLDQQINQYARKHGIEQTVEQLVFLFLEKIGLMWMTDRLIPAQEHMASHVVYRKICVAIDNLPAKEFGAGPSVLLFLPEGEIHDIGLNYVQFLLHKYGKNPIYLGSNSPLQEVQAVYEAKQPEYLYVHLTSVSESFDSNRYLQRLSATFPTAKILVSGSILKHKSIQPLPNVRLFYTLHDAREVLLSL